MRKLIGILGLSIAALLSLSACGGGGGSSGDNYSITLRADKTSLPVNITNVGITKSVKPGWAADYLGLWYGLHGLGVTMPYTTTLYVNAKVGNEPITGNQIGCNVAGGLETGSLYYLGGNPDVNDTEDIDYGNIPDITSATPNATVDAVATNYLSYRSIVFGANSGGGSFHFHTGDVAGVSRIVCSFTGNDNRVYSASLDMNVGGSTGLPSSMTVIAGAPDGAYVGTQGNPSNLNASTNVQAYVWDDANQPVPNPSAPNLQVSIKAVGNAWLGARLQSGGQSGANIQVSTVAGVATFALSSGPAVGPILLELTADRYDNNVSNGIQDPVVHYWVVYAVDALTGSLAVASADLPATNGQAFATVLGATGGQPPYTWSIVSGALPTGLALDSSGIIRGVVRTTPGTYVVVVQATDSVGITATGAVTITVTGSLPSLSVTSASISGTAGTAFSYGLSVTGGTPPYTWAWAGTPPAGVTLSSAGVISVPASLAAGTYSTAVTVSDSSSPSLSATANITITIAP